MALNQADQTWQDRLPSAGAFATVLGIVAIGTGLTAAVSYQHEYHLARGNGQADWVSALIPFTVDGMILVAGIGLLWALAYRVRGFRRLWRPALVLVVGFAATVLANLYADLHYPWLGPAVSASAGVSLFFMSDVAFWLLGEQRRLSAPDDDDRPPTAVACSCPPPPVTLAEALSLARAELTARGEKNGEQVLADRFGVSRHQVRQALTVPVAASVNGSGPDE